MAYKPCSNERRRNSPSPSARDPGLFTAGPREVLQTLNGLKSGKDKASVVPWVCFVSKCTRLLPVREANGRADFHCALSGLLRLPGIAGGFRDRTLGRAGQNRRDYSSGPSCLALLPALT